MKTFLCRAACALVLVSFGSIAAPPGRSAERGPLRRAVPVVTETEARVIVKYRADAAPMHAPPQHAQALATRLGLSLSDGRTIGARAQVVKGRGMSSRDLADRLAAQADVEYAVVDGRQYALAAPDDPLYPNNLASPTTPAAGQWYLRAPTSAIIVDTNSVVAAINAQAAWDITSGSGVVVAVLDTGVRFDHPDLAGKLLAGSDFISDTGVAADGDGRDADASDPGDFGCSTLPADERNSSWHGTQTAGLIGAATNNHAGMAGTGRDVTLLPVRVLGKCGGFDSDIQAAMLWAASLESGSTTTVPRARVINLSLGSAGACSATYQDVVQQVNARGVVVVVAAGNDGLAVGTPANCPGAIAVAGVRHAGTKVGYSDLGPEVAIAAPAGNCVNLTGTCLFPLLTTSNSGTTTPVANSAGGSIYTGGGSDASLGTSFSAPLVSGTVGLMLAANPSLTPTQVLSFLKSSARAFPSTGAGASVAACTAPTTVAQSSECYCTTATCGAGLLDAGAAVAAVAAISANIAVASTAATAGTAVALDGSGSRASLGATITGYQWAISSGATIANFTSSTNAVSATLLPSAAGSVVVALTITDNAGKQATSSVALSVAAPPAPTSSGGGGAMPVGWLLAWLVALIGLRAVTPRRRR